MRRVVIAAITLALPAVAAVRAGAVTAEPAMIVIAPGTPITVHGSGCAPGAAVRVTLASLHGTGTVLDTFPTNANGRFSRAIPIPSHGEPDGTATVVAECDNAEPLVSTIRVFQVNIRFIGQGALAGTGTSADVILTRFGAGLAALGSALLLIGRRSSRSPRRL